MIIPGDLFCVRFGNSCVFMLWVTLVLLLHGWSVALSLLGWIYVVGAGRARGLFVVLITVCSIVCLCAGQAGSADEVQGERVRFRRRL